MEALILILAAAGIAFADLHIKALVERYKPLAGKAEKERRILGGRLILRRHHNRGVMLNFGQNRQRLVAVLSVALTAVTAVLFLLSLGQKGNRLLKTGLTLLLGGAFSNTYDRLKRHYVVDYVSFPVRWKPLRNVVFNLADFCIMAGVLLTLLGG
jgi:signal peptidase II